MNHRRIFITRQDRERLTTMRDEALAAKHRDAATPGGPRKIKIAAIPYQPEAAGDFHL